MHTHSRLLGAEVSYYTAKIRAYLVHKPLPFVDILATRKVFKDEILPRIGWPVIPVLITPDGLTLQDTSEMIDWLEAHHPEHPLLPQTPLLRVISLLFELYADEWIKMPALHYRWHYDREFAELEFGRNNDPELPSAEQRRIGEKIARQFAGWLGPLGITSATIPAIEAEYLGLLADLEQHFAHHDFLFGPAPSLVDCALFGPLQAHLSRDPNSGRVMRRQAPRVIAWLARMQTAVPTRARAATDTLPPTMRIILQRLSRDYVPILCAQTRAFQAWLAAHRSEPIPRHIGTHEFELGRDTAHVARGTRALFTYDQWMLQRVLDAYFAADERARVTIEETLQDIGAAELLTLALPQRVIRRNYQLVRQSQV